MRLSNILFGLAIMTLIVTGFMLFLADGVSRYQPNVPDDYNTSMANIKVGLEGLSGYAGNSTERLDIEGNSNAISNFLDFFFGKGYQAANTLTGAVKLNYVIIDNTVSTGLEHTGMGPTIKAVAYLMIALFIILLLLHFIVKSEWL